MALRKRPREDAKEDRISRRGNSQASPSPPSLEDPKKSRSSSDNCLNVNEKSTNEERRRQQSAGGR